jgi:hypothetical protein
MSTAQRGLLLVAAEHSGLASEFEFFWVGRSHLPVEQPFGRDVVVIEHRDDVNVGMTNIPSGCNEPDLLRTEPLCDLACEVVDGAPEGRLDVVIEFVEGTRFGPGGLAGKSCAPSRGLSASGAWAGAE